MVRNKRTNCPCFLCVYSQSHVWYTDTNKFGPIISNASVHSHLNNNAYTVKPVYKGHSKEPENLPFMSSCSLYTG
jgi:hypothetical protein